MDNIEKVEEIAEKLRREPYSFLTNDCITKSVRLKRACQAMGIPAKVVVCLGLARAWWFGRWFTIPVIHAWGEVAGRRIETSRPLGSTGIWCIVPISIRPLVSLRF
jgi:hypothetical protein